MLFLKPTNKNVKLCQIFIFLNQKQITQNGKNRHIKIYAPCVPCLWLCFPVFRMGEQGGNKTQD